MRRGTIALLLTLALAKGLAQETTGRIEKDTLRVLPIELLSGSADKVTRERMNKGLVNNPIEALSGQAAGVSVTSVGSNPMAMLNSVRVRGTTSITGGNDPLVIIDGVSSDASTLSSLYPAAIESVPILTKTQRSGFSKAERQVMDRRRLPHQLHRPNYTNRSRAEPPPCLQWRQRHVKLPCLHRLHGQQGCSEDKCLQELHRQG